MKKFILSTIALSIGITYADYTVHIELDHKPKFSKWTPSDAIVGDWLNIGNAYNCLNWAPLSSAIPINQPFIQTATDCQQNQERTVQKMITDELTGEQRKDGAEYTEEQTITISQTRNAIGGLEHWIDILSLYTNWTNTGAITGCSNWTPDPSTITINELFTQTATDCQQPQTRSRQDREQETTTLNIRNKGEPVTENQTITTSSTRSSTGTKETWVATSSTYTDWVNSGAITGCSNWTPDPSTKPLNEVFTQTATDCDQPQTRNRQDREQETTTLTIRNKGTAVVENRTTAATSTRSATGTQIVKQCMYSKTAPISEWRYFLAIDPNNGGNRIPKTSISYNGVLLTGTGYMNHISTPVVIGGYRYTQGSLISSNNYQVCQEPI